VRLAALESQQHMAQQLASLQAQQVAMAQQLAAAQASNDSLRAELTAVQVCCRVGRGANIDGGLSMISVTEKAGNTGCLNARVGVCSQLNSIEEKDMSPRCG
jgi:hypothetical protein